MFEQMTCSLWNNWCFLRESSRTRKRTCAVLETSLPNRKGSCRIALPAPHHGFDNQHQKCSILQARELLHQRLVCEQKRPRGALGKAHRIAAILADPPQTPTLVGLPQTPTQVDLPQTPMRVYLRATVHPCPAPKNRTTPLVLRTKTWVATERTIQLSLEAAAKALTRMVVAAAGKVVGQQDRLALHSLVKRVTAANELGCHPNYIIIMFKYDIYYIGRVRRIISVSGPQSQTESTG
mmetsp:Transcript_11155/g.21207  ORF Transcript_11155/g.21207 Transcript_11155/m.21207 type:complete len:237 (-) Transcript_11155:162-872(-)